MKKIAAMATLLWFCASAVMALPTQGVPAFQKASANWVSLETELKRENVLHGDMVDIDKMARGLQKWYATQNRLTEAGKNPDTFAKVMVEAHGEKLWVEDFKRLTQAGRFLVPTFLVARADKAVPAASAPTQVAEAVTSPVKTGSVPPEVSPLAPATVATTSATAPVPAVTTPATAVVDREQLSKWIKFSVENDGRIEAQAKAWAILQGRIDETQRLVRDLKSRAPASAKLSSADQAMLDEALGELKKLGVLRAEIEQAKTGLTDGVKQALMDIENAKGDALAGVKASQGEIMSQVKTENDQLRNDVDRRVSTIASQGVNPWVWVAIALSFIGLVFVYRHHETRGKTLVAGINQDKRDRQQLDEILQNGITRAQSTADEANDKHEDPIDWDEDFASKLYGWAETREWKKVDLLFVSGKKVTIGVRGGKKANTVNFDGGPFGLEQDIPIESRKKNARWKNPQTKLFFAAKDGTLKGISSTETPVATPTTSPEPTATEEGPVLSTTTVSRTDSSTGDEGESRVVHEEGTKPAKSTQHDPSNPAQPSLLNTWLAGRRASAGVTPGSTTS